MNQSSLSVRIFSHGPLPRVRSDLTDNFFKRTSILVNKKKSYTHHQRSLNFVVWFVNVLMSLKVVLRLISVIIAAILRSSRALCAESSRKCTQNKINIALSVVVKGHNNKRTCVNYSDNIISVKVEEKDHRKVLKLILLNADAG